MSKLVAQVECDEFNARVKRGALVRFGKFEGRTRSGAYVSGDTALVRIVGVSGAVLLDDIEPLEPTPEPVKQSQVSVRMPRPMHLALLRLAHQQGMSLNGLCLAALERELEEATMNTGGLEGHEPGPGHGPASARPPACEEARFA